jgi:hypothetical protein
MTKVIQEREGREMKKSLEKTKSKAKKFGVDLCVPESRRPFLPDDLDRLDPGCNLGFQKEVQPCPEHWDYHSRLLQPGRGIHLL